MLVGSYSYEGVEYRVHLHVQPRRRRLREGPRVPRRASRRSGAGRRVRAGQGRRSRPRPTDRSTAWSTRMARAAGSSRRSTGSGSRGLGRRPLAARKWVREGGAVSQVGIIVGSRSDIEVAQRAAAVLGELEVDSEIRVISAHRAPDLLGRFVAGAADRGIGVFIAIAGLAAHLPGVVASQTTLPVIGVAMPGGVAGRSRRAARDRPDAEGRAGRGGRRGQRRERGAARGPDPGGRRSGAARPARGATGGPGAGDRGRPGERGALTLPSGFRWERQIGGSSRPKVVRIARSPASPAHARARNGRPEGRLWPAQPRICRWQRKSSRQRRPISLGPKEPALHGQQARGGPRSSQASRRLPEIEAFDPLPRQRRGLRVASAMPGRRRPPPDARRTLDPMDDERWEPGMPVLERQAVPASPEPRRAPSPTTLPPSLQPASRRARSPRRSRRRSRSTTSCCRCRSSSWRDRDHGARARARRSAARSSSCASLIAAPLLIVTTADADAPDLAVGLGLDARRPRPRALPARLGRGQRSSASRASLAASVAVLVA